MQLGNATEIKTCYIKEKIINKNRRKYSFFQTGKLRVVHMKMTKTRNARKQNSYKEFNNELNYKRITYVKVFGGHLVVTLFTEEQSLIVFYPGDKKTNWYFILISFSYSTSCQKKSVILEIRTRWISSSVTSKSIQFGMLVFVVQHSCQPKTEGCRTLLFLPAPSCFFQCPFVSSVDFLSKD